MPLKVGTELWIGVSHCELGLWQRPNCPASERTTERVRTIMSENLFRLCRQRLRFGDATLCLGVPSEPQCGDCQAAEECADAAKSLWCGVVAIFLPP